MYCPNCVLHTTGLGSKDAWKCLHVVTSFFFFWTLLAWLALSFTRSHKR
jgi:hypothetical protein